MAIYALYNFARQVDDEADAAGVENLPERLKVHRERISRAVRGDYGDDPILRVLAEAIDRYSIPGSELQMLIDGVEMDFRHIALRRRSTTSQDYCNLVASVVGRMCVRIFGFSDPVALERADDLGLALQLTNILRDVREDAVDMSRIYLPQEDLARFGIPESALYSAERSRPGWDELVAEQVARARATSRRDTKCCAIFRAVLRRACRRWPGSTKSCSRRSNAIRRFRCEHAPRSRRPRSCASWCGRGCRSA